MKLGVVGPENSVELIKTVIEKDWIPVELVPLQYNAYTEALELVEKHQPDVDAIFFSGPLPFQYVSRYVHPLVPWEYIPNNMLSVAYALIKAAFVEKADISKISTDSFTRQMFLEAYREIGLNADSVTIRSASDRVFTDDYIDYLVEHHRNCYKSGLTHCCVTGICEVEQRLKREGIPTAMAQISHESIALYINKLRLTYSEHIQSINEPNRQITVILLDISYVEEHTIFSQSTVALLQRKNKIAEMIYTFAQALGAAIVQDNEGRFLIFSSGERFEIDSDRYRRIRILDQLSQLDLIDHVSVGIGVGESNQSAKFNAESALRNAHRAKINCAFMVREKTIYGPITPFSHRRTQSYSQQRLVEISTQSGVSLRSLEQIETVVRQYGMEYATPAQLSKISGINPRNMNRILNKLEDAGYVSVVGKESRVSLGRPGRIIKIHFTE